MTDRAEGTEKRQAGDGAVSWARRVRLWLAWFVGLNAVWLVLISAFVLEETLLGILASAVAATAAVAVGEQRPFRFRPRAKWVLAAWRLPFDALRESGMVLARLPRQAARPGRSMGRFRVVHVSLPEDQDRAQTKAALLIAGGSVSPNMYVIEVDREAGTMLIHELAFEEDR
jgi:multisubunit Na+/H+ antiporter MnhE subunit